MRLTRTGGMGVPFREIVDVRTDGSFDMWRSVSSGAVGSFAGTVPAASLERLHGVITAALGSGAMPDEELQADAVVDTYTFDDVEVEMSRWGPAGGGPWNDLASTSGSLLDELLDQPDAALTMRVDPGLESVALERHGEGTLVLRFDQGATLTATVWQGGAAAGSWSTGIAETPIRTEAGWAVTLPLGHDLDVPAGAVVGVDLVGWLEHDGLIVQMELGDGS
ncbi:MAG TPA: hypothetical protein VM143_12675 [Acidimicrobiales bacterium]|nr:hypothetical protein [Acidimicrobiales bacterium]